MTNGGFGDRLIKNRFEAMTGPAQILVEGAKKMVEYTLEKCASPLSVHVLIPNFQGVVDPCDRGLHMGSYVS